MATDGDLEGSSVPHGRISKLGVNVTWLADDMTYKETKHRTNVTKLVNVQLMYGSTHYVLLAVDIPTAFITPFFSRKLAYSFIYINCSAISHFI